MGHLRLGRLYKSRKWVEVIDLLDHDDLSVPQISAATVRAAEKELLKLGTNPVLNYCFWLLVHITTSAKNNKLKSQLEQIGIKPDQISTTFTLISSLGDVIRNKSTEYDEINIFSEITNLTFRQTLTETIASQPKSLFGSSFEDIQNACSSYSSEKQFGLLARKFFSNLLSRSFTYFINKELSNHIGPEHVLANTESAIQFNNALNNYSYLTSKIVEDFAGGWYSKHNWETGGRISEEESLKFIAYALKKLRMESEGVNS
jgi:hypothetical protein